MLYRCLEKYSATTKIRWTIDLDKKEISRIGFTDNDGIIDCTTDLTLDKITIPAIFRGSDGKPINIKSIGSSVFAHSFQKIKIRTLEVGQGIECLKKNAFEGKAVNIEEIIIPNSIKTISRLCFSHSSISTITLPNSITNIYPYAFAYTEKLKKIKIPNSCKKIGECAFALSNIEEVIIKDNVKDIGRAAFYGCKNLKEFTWPEKCKVIQDNCFNGCDNLCSVKFNAPIVEIQTSAFDGTKITELDFSHLVTAPIINDDVNLIVKKPFYTMG